MIKDKNRRRSKGEIIAPRSNNNEIISDGFEFIKNKNNGISVITPNYETFAGAYGTSAITSHSTTPLDGLQIAIMPDNFDFRLNSKKKSNQISILWSEEKIDALAGYNSTTGKYNKGLYRSEFPSTNGLRHLIPVAEENNIGLPADAAIINNGKALCITVRNDHEDWGNKYMIATTVSIVYYDGHYINGTDGRPGYRWVFTERNYGGYGYNGNSDSSGIVSKFQEIDLTYGLVINIRSDQTHGYIININGKDYYNGREIAYFPDAHINGTAHSALNVEDYVCLTDTYLNSMTYARQDIDLSGLKNAGEGYLTIGAVSASIKGDEHPCNYTITHINDVPASEWNGEASPKTHTHTYIHSKTIPNNCLNIGKKVYLCSCGDFYTEDYDNTLNGENDNLHVGYWSDTITPTCYRTGERKQICAICSKVLSTEYIEKTEHNYYYYESNNDATCSADGTKTAYCLNYRKCGSSDTITDEGTMRSHSYVDYIFNNDATCVSDGTETSECIYGCGNTDIKIVTGTMTGLHTFIEYIYDNNATCTADGTETAKCKYCDIIDTKIANDTQLQHSFTKYQYNNDTTCTTDATETAYCDYDCGTTDTVTITNSRLGHSFTKYNYDNNATCTADGTTTSYCDNGCGETKTFTVTGSMLPHTYIPYVISADMMLYECVCGDYYTVIIPEGGHLFSQYVYNNDATCTKNGTEMAYCDCGHNAVDVREVEGTKLEHIFTSYVYNKDATCAADGTETASCNFGCGTTDTRVAEGTKTGHSYVVDVIVEGDCITGRIVLYMCSCGDYYKETIEGVGHSFTEYVSNNDATCVTDGTLTAKCDTCDATDTIEESDSATGHSFGEWYVILEPTYFDEGAEERECSLCSEKESNTLPVKEYVNPFTDVKESAWFYDAVSYVVKKGYMNGMSAGKFSPNSNITREQFVLILANIAGVDTNEFKPVSSGFKDVPTGKWYSGAVTWAVREGYVSGVSADKFGLGQSIQRAALARMLYNYASKNGIDVSGRADLSAFGDAAMFEKAGNAWMKEPIQWAVDAGIISGMKVNGVNCVNPKGTATRAQAARMLMQFDSISTEIE